MAVQHDRCSGEKAKKGKGPGRIHTPPSLAPALSTPDARLQTALPALLEAQPSAALAAYLRQPRGLGFQFPRPGSASPSAA